MNIQSTRNTDRDQHQADFVKQLIQSSSGLSGNHAVIKHYEASLAAFFNVNHAVAISSGTASIYCSLLALNIKRGDVVIVPVTGAVMTCLPLITLGATPLFVDCSKDSFAICPTHLRKLLQAHDNIKAIISVSMWGYPGLSHTVKSICKYYQLPIIEDAAQAIGSKTDGMYEGAYGTLGCFSTHEIKLISTGEGGFVLTNDDELAHRLKVVSRLGINKERTSLKFGDVYGFNFKLNAMSAALGVTELEKLNQRIQKRQTRHNQWSECLRNHPHLSDINLYDSQVSLNGYAFVKLCSYDLGSNELSFRLAESGLQTDVVRYQYKLLPQYPVFASYYSDKRAYADFPNAVSLINRLLVLPNHDGITSFHMEQSVNLIDYTLNTILDEESICGS